MMNNKRGETPERFVCWKSTRWNKCARLPLSGIEILTFRHLLKKKKKKKNNTLILIILHNYIIY